MVILIWLICCEVCDALMGHTVAESGQLKGVEIMMSNGAKESVLGFKSISRTENISPKLITL